MKTKVGKIMNQGLEDEMVCDTSHRCLLCLTLRLKKNKTKLHVPFQSNDCNGLIYGVLSNLIQNES